jgi:hypothetical protein
MDLLNLYISQYAEEFKKPFGLLPDMAKVKLILQKNRGVSPDISQVDEILRNLEELYNNKCQELGIEIEEEHV